MKDEELHGLPGGELICEGLRDLRSGERSILGLLVLSAATRLRSYGIDVPNFDLSGATPAHEFYKLLCEQHGSNAYSLYNSYRRRLVSMMRALGSVGS